MDPPSYSVEAFPLKRGEDLPSEPPGPPMVPYTTVDISTEPPPRDHVVWSLCSLLFLSPCCLGLAAVIYSFKARDSKMVGDIRSARRYGATALGINIATIVVFLILVCVCIYLYLNRPFYAGFVFSAASLKWI